MYTLLTKEVQFIWTPKCNEAFLQLKKLLTIVPILKGPDWSIPFHIHTNASDYVVGAILGQKPTNLENAIYYISRTLHGPELNYTVIEKELLTIVYALNKFRHYVTGYAIFVHTDHSAIKYLMNKLVVIGRLARWLLLLQEFDITIIDKPGKSNIVVDYMSRLTIVDEDPTLIEDTFLDDHFFHMVTHTPWYVDIANYLAANRLPPHFSYKEKRKLA